MSLSNVAKLCRAWVRSALLPLLVVAVCGACTVGAVRAAARSPPYTRPCRQAGGTDAAALADGAAGNANTPDRGPALADCRAANGYRAPALAHDTAGHRNGAAGAKSPSTYADGSPTPTNAAAADCDRVTADGHACAIPYARPARAPGTRPVRAGCGRVGLQTTALPHRRAGRYR